MVRKKKKWLSATVGIVMSTIVPLSGFVGCGPDSKAEKPVVDADPVQVAASGTTSGDLAAKGKFYPDYASHDEAHLAAKDLNVRLAQEGFVLLKNENNALPLSGAERRVTTFGYRSANLKYGGEGSGGGNVGGIVDKNGKCYYKVPPTTLKIALEQSGFVVNKRVWDMYSSFSSATYEIDPARNISGALKATYSAYNDAAIVVIGRDGREGGDLPTKNCVGYADPNKHSLELTDNEVATIRHAKQNFKKVIVLLNASPALQIADLNESKTESNLGVDAILHVGLPGNDGMGAIGGILTGEVSPSGRTVDIWATDLLSMPAVKNFGDYAHTERANNDLYKTDGTRLSYSSVEYREDVYLGYRYYETAHDDMNAQTAGTGDEWYKKQIQFPFGYGLSYTDFEWALVGSSASKITSANQEISMRVKVTNKGSFSGKDVVEVYAHTPYTADGIEKSSQVLAGFAKTKLLKPNESDVVEIKFVAQDIASFDYNDANGNGFVGYELEKGDYVFSARKNSNTSVLEVMQKVTDDIKCETDYTTGKKIEAVLSQSDGTWANYNTVNETLKNNLLSRTEVAKGNLPASVTKEDATISQATFELLESQMHAIAQGLSAEDKATDPWYVKGDGIPSTWKQADAHDASKIVTKLAKMAGVDYTEITVEDGTVKTGNTENDKKWENFLNQFTWRELTLILEGGKRSDNLLLHGDGLTQKPNYSGENALREQLADYGIGDFLQQDGPQQLKANNNLGTSNGDGAFYVNNVVIASTWNVELAEEHGRMYGNDSLFLGISGVYAPAMNIHRTPFAGRNFEYYSEDGLLSGKIVAAHLRGLTSKGAIAIVKHLFLNDQEYDRSIAGGVATYLTEQAAREIYLKPFEIAFKEGNANGIMAAFNRIGNIPAAANTAVYEKIVRGEFGFKGYAMTDAWTDGAYIHADAVLRGSVDGLLRWDTPNNMEYGVWENGKVMVSKNGTHSYDRNNAVASITGEKMAGNTQWYLVRKAAQHILYAFANSNDIQNGVAKDTEITVKLANGMTYINKNIFEEAIGTTDISDLKITGTLPTNLKLSNRGVLTNAADGWGNQLAIAKGEATLTATYKHDGLPTAKRATIKIKIDNEAEIEVKTLKKGVAADAKLVSARFEVDAPLVAKIKGMQHGENETVIAATGVVEKVEYSLVTGSSIPGLTLNKDGTFSGTPTAAGTYEVYVRVDASGLVRGSGNASGAENVTLSNIYKYSVVVGDGENGTATFVANDSPSELRLTRELINKGVKGNYTTIFSLDRNLLLDNKAQNKDTVLVGTGANINRRSFLVFVTFGKDGKLTVKNDQVGLIPGSEVEVLTADWKVEGGALVVSNVKSNLTTQLGTLTVVN